LVVSLFGPEQWDMITSTAELIDMTLEDIIRGLGPTEIIQHEITSDEWNEFFIKNGWIDKDDLPDDDEDIF
jgi:hypothetical protein